MATDIGTRIKRARERMRWSQQRLADALKVDRKTIDNWENGRTRPRSSVGAIEAVLGVRLDADPPESEALAEIKREFPSVHAAITREFPGDPATQERVAEAIAREMRGEPQPPPTSPAVDGRERNQQAG
jgi:transcriptional regulator with XRE-family HTH domain